MNIGFLHPDSRLSVDVTTLLKQFVKDGHKVVFMTLCPKGHIHEAMEDDDIIFEYLDDGTYKRVHQSLPKAQVVAELCRKYELDVLYCNFAMAEMLGWLASFFCKTKMIYLRHHSTEAAQLYSNWKGITVDKIINKIQPKTIVPSLLVRQDVIDEGVKPEKVVMIPYCYDFKSYPTPDKEKVAEIKRRFPNKRILLMISRYVPQKRYELAIEVAEKLKKSAVKDFVFLCLGNGELEEKLQKMIAEKDLEDVFILEGFTKNVISYVAACDLLVHPSASEASCHAIKEAGWMKKNVICCENVGDFSDYLVDGKNAFVVEKDSPVQPMYEKIKRFLNGEIENKEAIAEELHDTILNRFTPEAVITKHYEVIDSLLSN